MKRMIVYVLVLSMLACLASCRSASQEHFANSTVPVQEGAQEGLGDLYNGIETGILMEGSLGSYWKLNGDTITLFGGGAFLSMAAGFFPWRNFDERIVKVRVESGVTSIGSYAFHSYDFLEEVIVEDGAFVGMGIGCFGDNTRLKRVELGDSLRVIPSEAFIRCTSLEYVSIPATVTQIGYEAFKDCDSLKTVYFGGSQDDWNRIVIENGNEILSQAEILFQNRNIDQ